MSFSGSVKEELIHKEIRAKHCRIAELSGIYSICGLDQGADPEAEIVLRAENPLLRSRVFTLLRKTFKIDACDPEGQESVPDKDLIRIRDPQEAQIIRTALMIRDDQDLKERICGRSCCIRSFLRGAFLAGGSVSDPEKSYHFEIVCSTAGLAEQICFLIGVYGPEAHYFLRKNRYVVYVKEGTQIVDLLNIMGANVSLMQMENVRIVKDVRNRVNRQVNCEMANLTKTVNASVRETEEIRRLEEAGLLKTLPQTLQETARLRLAHPDASLRELGEMHDPPIGRSGVNHRLKKISEIASGTVLLNGKIESTATGAGTWRESTR